MPQSFFKAREDRCFVTGVHIDDAIGKEPSLGDGGREEVLPCDTPQDLALRSRGNSGGEQRSRRAEFYLEMYDDARRVASPCEACSISRGTIVPMQP